MLPDDCKVTTLQHLPLPVTKTVIRSFLGLIGYQRQFLPQFAELAKPLYGMLKSDIDDNLTTVWEDSHTEALSGLKQAVTQAASLRYPDLHSPFHMEVAAGCASIAAVLTQIWEGKYMPIA